MSLHMLSTKVKYVMWVHVVRMKSLTLKYQSAWTVALKWVVCGTHEELEPNFIKVFGM